MTKASLAPAPTETLQIGSIDQMNFIDRYKLKFL